MKKYFKKIFDKYDFSLIEKRAKSSMPFGAVYQYENDQLKLRLVNDKGIVNVDVSPTYQEDYWDIDAVKELMLIRSNGETIEDSNVNVNALSIDQQADFLDKNMEIIEILFNKNNYETTLKDLDRLGTRRAEIMLGFRLPKKNDS